MFEDEERNENMMFIVVPIKKSLYITLYWNIESEEYSSINQ